MNIKTKIALTALLIIAMVFNVGCVGSKAPKQEVDTKEPKNLSLKVGLMPAVDAAPMLIAEKNGYFKELGLDIELIVFNNAQDRQSALQTNSIDGAMTDLIAVATNVNGGFDIKATTITSGMFPVLVKEGFAEKKDIKVAMMEVSVTNFLIDEWLGNDYNIEKVFINEIPARLEMIKSGNVDMGLFPEPMASMGALDGLEKRIYDPEDGYCPDVLGFTAKALSEKAEAIKLFHEAYDKAVEDINKDESIAREILIEKLSLKPEIKDSMILPEYTKTYLPDNAYLEKIISWVENVLKKDMNIRPEQLVERKFVE
ncbi:ABC transporter substrate-binding protein [Lutispora thermophila]|uniref:NitT/TauT family transport system substrate-binding protein n=1 Tax=Lutispora thermophila DSM 19022 TaxID=1122184 RepID=A0A1M6I868_9FIRM|nr:ABC transporter substrate-binding protein [Lutispora thermophila]SHJ30670.1 NitT/TauT family transport system substrate-binding protein [Lutispora thermophila DSM 19022]